MTEIDQFTKDMFKLSHDLVLFVVSKRKIEGLTEGQIRLKIVMEFEKFLKREGITFEYLDLPNYSESHAIIRITGPSVKDIYEMLPVEPEPLPENLVKEDPLAILLYDLGGNYLVNSFTKSIFYQISKKRIYRVLDDTIR